MARNYYACSDLIHTAKQQGVLLAVFQQSFFAPFYVFAKETAVSGVLGDIKQVSIHYNVFSRAGTGRPSNTGPRPIGFALDVLDFD